MCVQHFMYCDKEGIFGVWYLVYHIFAWCFREICGSSIILSILIDGCPHLHTIYDPHFYIKYLGAREFCVWCIGAGWRATHIADKK